MAEERDPPPDLSGQTVGDFRVLRKLGEGGMGQVYLARQVSLRRDVALKVLRKDLADNPAAVRRFQAEAEAVARVTHPNIVQVYAVGEHAGLRYMALEYVPGRNLREYLARKGPPDLPAGAAVLRQVAAALQRAADEGIVHRDIKPENILVTRRAEVKVADFGLSRCLAPDPDGDKPAHLTQSGMTLGTPLYMSPEQVQGHPVDHRSDLYSFGVTAYHLLAGHPPFRGTTAFEVAAQHVQADPPPLAAARPDLPAALCGVVHKLLAKRPEDRYQTAREVIRDLARVQKGLPTEAPPPAAAGPALPAARARPRWPGRAAAAVALAAAAAGGWRGYGLAHPPADPAAPAAGPGLPAGRPPGPVTSARERALRATVGRREAGPADVADAAVGLGLLLVGERRLDEAEAEFARLDRVGAKGAAGPAAVAGRLGRAIVLAHRDRWQESVAQFEAAVPPARPAQRAALDRVLAAHPDLGQAVADALARNADNGAKLPDRLDALRSPAGPR